VNGHHGLSAEKTSRLPKDSLFPDVPETVAETLTIPTSPSMSGAQAIIPFLDVLSYAMIMMENFSFKDLLFGMTTISTFHLLLNEASVRLGHKTLRTLMKRSSLW
jgi:hypothetical protein